jgi:hypothetical protein
VVPALDEESDVSVANSDSVGHNSIMVSAQVGLAVLRAFDLDEGGSLPL